MQNVPNKPESSPFVWIYSIVSIAALGILGLGAYLAMSDAHQWTMLAAGCISIIAVAVTWPLAVTGNRTRDSQAQAALAARRIDEQLQKIAAVMELMSEHQLLSDRAKSVAYRDKDREAIRHAINEEIARGEWDAAVALADQFEKAFGSATEAQGFRDEIDAKRAESVRQQIADGMAVIDRYCRNEQWTNALREAEKLIKQFPGNEQVKHLPVDIEGRRQSHKKSLMQSFHDAQARQDNDASLDILKQLDPYLTPAEAESMQETVRTLFRERLNNLAAAFKVAYKENRLSEAIRLGEQIQSEFPNSRIAHEIHDMMANLRQRSAEPATAGA